MTATPAIGVAISSWGCISAASMCRKGRGSSAPMSNSPRKAPETWTPASCRSPSRMPTTPRRSAGTCSTSAGACERRWCIGRHPHGPLPTRRARRSVRPIWPPSSSRSWTGTDGLRATRCWSPCRDRVPAPPGRWNRNRPTPRTCASPGCPRPIAWACRVERPVRERRATMATRPRATMPGMRTASASASFWIAWASPVVPHCREPLAMMVTPPPATTPGERPACVRACRWIAPAFPVDRCCPEHPAMMATPPRATT